MIFLAPLIIGACSPTLSVELARRKRLLDARVPLDQIDGYLRVNLTDGTDPFLPRCAYCGLRGSGVRCDGCGAPK